MAKQNLQYGLLKFNSQVYVLNRLYHVKRPLSSSRASYFHFVFTTAARARVHGAVTVTIRRGGSGGSGGLTTLRATRRTEQLLENKQ